DADEGATPDLRDDRYFFVDELMRLRLSEVVQRVDDQDASEVVPEIPYHQMPHGRSPQKRLVQHERIVFFKDDEGALDQPLPLGHRGMRGLTFETYRLALTDSLLTAILGARLTADVRAALAAEAASGYLSGAALAARFPGVETAGQFWVRSGVAGFAPDAAQHFFLPQQYTDPFGGITTVAYGAPRLRPVASTDAMGNVSRVPRVDYRLLAALELQDINGNLSQVAY